MRTFKSLQELFWVNDNLSCCGLVEIASRRNLPSKEEFLWALRDYPRVLFIATTIPSQRSYISLLKKVGFKKKRTFRNGNSWNLVTVWFFHIKEKEND